jgi:hypothetical protein
VLTPSSGKMTNEHPGTDTVWPEGKVSFSGPNLLYSVRKGNLKMNDTVRNTLSMPLYRFIPTNSQECGITGCFKDWKYNHK